VLHLDLDRAEERATTSRVMAAMERVIGWLLWGPRQHDADLLRSLGRLSSANIGEITVKRS
jgi:hypothetical protein